MGFSSVLDGKNRSHDHENPSSVPAKPQARAKRHTHRPSDPSWAEFLESGFTDDAVLPDPASLSFPPEQMLPPLSSSPNDSPNSHLSARLRNVDLEPGELDRRDRLELDETFWWTWMSSLGEEETLARRAVFGRCACVETEIVGRRWLIIEERVKEVMPEPESEPEEEEPVQIEKERKSRFSFGKRAKPVRRVSSQKPVERVVSKQAEPAIVHQSRAPTPPTQEQQAKVQAAANAIVQQQADRDIAKHLQRRGRTGDNDSIKTSSVLSLQPFIAKDAGPALQWARKFDKEVIRARYMGDGYAGRGGELSPNTIGAPNQGFRSFSAPKLLGSERALPPLPQQSSTNLSDGIEAPIPTRGPGTQTFKENQALPSQLSAGAGPDFSPLPERVTAPKSLVPSPLALRRKQVGSVDENVRNKHQYMDPTGSRSSTPEHSDPFAPSTPPANGAAGQSDTSVESPPLDPVNMKLSKQGSVRGLRKLFGKRVASEPIKVTQAHEKGLSEPPSQSQQSGKIGRKRSFLRRNRGAPVSSARAPPSPHLAPIESSPTRARTTAQASHFAQASPGQVVTEHSSNVSPDQYDASHINLDATVPRDDQIGSPTFSDFTQGAAPSSMREYESENDSIVHPLPASHHRRSSSQTQYRTRAAQLLYAETLEEQMRTGQYDTPGNSVDLSRGRAEHPPSEMNNALQPEISQGHGDRWAAIKHDAVERRRSESLQAKNEEAMMGRAGMGENGAEECEYRSSTSDVTSC